MRGLNAASTETGAGGPESADKGNPNTVDGQQTLELVRPKAKVNNDGPKTHSSVGVPGAMVVPAVEAQPAETPKEDEPTVEEDIEIESLEQRIEDLEKQLMREEVEPNTPIVRRPERPTKEQVERHNTTHAQ